MDSYREHPRDFDLPSAAEAPAADDVASVIGTDERRLHVRAYNYWVSLLDGRDFPSIEDLEPDDLKDFSANSVLLDFTCGRDNPALPYVGTAIRDECALDDDMRTIDDVPSRSLLSRLTDHYMQIIANRAPVGFEAEFDNPRGATICYRGILMPFSSDGESIDFIYGVINWKLGDGATAAANSVIVPAISEEPVDLTADEPMDPAQDEWIESPPSAANLEVSEPAEVAPPVLDDHAGLADRLSAARESADSVKAGEGRTRAALYQALALAYDFALAADADPHEYRELLEESGVKAQARAPMTPIVKLVFGIDYDKARLTEFAAALSFAQRQSLGVGQFQQFIERQAGGLKALVAAERQARRPDVNPDANLHAALDRLRSSSPFSLTDLPAGEEFELVLVRRQDVGGYEPVALVDDRALLDRAIRRAA